MTEHGTRNVVCGALAVLAGLVASRRRSAQPGTRRRTGRRDNYDELFARYLRRRAPADAARAGDSGRLDERALDATARARHVNDLVTIRVVESITASGHGRLGAVARRAAPVDRGARASSASRTKLPDVDRSDQPGRASRATPSFKGGGTTTRAGELTAVDDRARGRGAAQRRPRPRGRARDRHQRRPPDGRADAASSRVADVAPDNVVPSTSIGQLRIRYFGRGLMKDNLKPGWLIRILNKIF